MKYAINILSYLMIVIFGVTSCTNDDILDVQSSDTGYITLEIPQNIAVTKAAASTTLTAVENAVKQLDIFIISSTSKNIEFYERKAVSASSGKITLGTKRSDYVADAGYYVIVIANSTADETTLAAYSTLEDIQRMEQADERVHLTGIEISNVSTPSHFLMDGVAYLKGSAEPQELKAVVLYDGNDSNETTLSVRLRRAASKVTVRLKEGNLVKYCITENIDKFGYYFKNLPYYTYSIKDNIQGDVIPSLSTDRLRTAYKSATPYSTYTSNSDEDVVTIVGYVYSHSWEGKSFFEYGTSLILNIPLEFGGEVYPNSFYQILLTKNNYFDRNTHYEIEASINAPGAQDPSEPVEINDIKFKVVDWDKVDISINSDNGPQFLQLSHDTLKIYNSPLSEDELRFSSSSPIKSVTIDNDSVYFYNKFNQYVNVPYSIRSDIKFTPDAGNNGYIDIESPLPTNNTIRYIKVTVTNQDGISRNVYVEQYPLVYVTNRQSWYSYRDDFNCTYERAGSRNTSVDIAMSGSYYNQYWSGGYDYNPDYGYFFHSKVTNPKSTAAYNNTYRYVYTSNSNSAYGYNNSYYLNEEDANTRMYHIRITATSNKYNIGHPRIDDNGYTEMSDDNAQLVSPSFVIASRLGTIRSGANSSNLQTINNTEDTNNNGIGDRREVFNHHCANYVEVYQDKEGNAVIYDNWRVPTEAELKIIEELQGTKESNPDAIDYLLNGYWYMCSNGMVKNENHESSYNSGSVCAVRCVRDAYDDK